MIVATYHQASKGVFGPGMEGKWYGTYREGRGTALIPRYIGPKGWERNCHWWATRREAEEAFIRHGQEALPISDLEYNDYRTMQQDTEDSFNNAPPIQGQPEVKPFDPFNL